MESQNMFLLVETCRGAEGNNLWKPAWVQRWAARSEYLLQTADSHADSHADSSSGIACGDTFHHFSWQVLHMQACVCVGGGGVFCSDKYIYRWDRNVG